MSFEITQYILPNGRQVKKEYNLPPNEEAKAKRLIEIGYRFESEILTTGEVYITISKDDEDGEDVLHNGFTCPNGPEVIRKMIEMIDDTLSSLNPS